MKTKIHPLALLTFLLVACGHKYEYWDVSKFHMVKDALQDDEPVRLLYTSNGPDQNPDRKYYIHLVAVSQRTGDTVNILTLVNNGLRQKEDEGRIFNYLDENSPATKLVVLGDKIKPGDEIDKMELPKAYKVARAPGFDFIADNNYPTVIGSIGISSGTRK